MLMENLGVQSPAHGERMGTRGKHVSARRVQDPWSTASLAVMGYLKNDLSGEDNQVLLGLVEDDRQGLLPLIVPLTLLKHHLTRHPVPEWVPVPFRVHHQVYLNPYPRELMLRNHV
jgi:uncharacterized protein YbgA (DUF1722 family)